MVVPGGEGAGGGDVRGERDGTDRDAGADGRRAATWNAITALATLCEEVQELDGTFRSSILPSLALFEGAAGNDGVDDGGAPPRAGTPGDVLDEAATRARESALLARAGTFLPALQRAANGAARLRRLVKNMVVQLGAVQTPAAAPFYGERRDGDGGEGGGGSGEEDDGAAARRGEGDGTGPTQAPVFGPGVPMHRLGRALATALRMLVALDAAVAANADLQEAWAMYKDVVIEWSEQKRTVRDRPGGGGWRRWRRRAASCVRVSRVVGTVTWH